MGQTTASLGLSQSARQNGKDETASQFPNQREQLGQAWQTASLGSAQGLGRQLEVGIHVQE